MPNSPFEELTVAEVAGRLQLESHFSFHDYDGDGRIVRHYAEDATIEGDLDLDALFWNGEFFDSDGDMICPNGNVELVQALLAGREILRSK